jgi:hypothetical protein
MEYCQIFLQSNLLEFPVYLCFFKFYKFEWSLLQGSIFTTGMNLITHPIVYFTIMNMKMSYLHNILLAELFAIVAETFILFFSLKRNLFPCLLASVLANLTSWQLSPMLTYAFHS